MPKTEIASRFKTHDASNVRDRQFAAANEKSRDASAVHMETTV